jgi:hypothetical protein
MPVTEAPKVPLPEAAIEANVPLNQPEGEEPHD